MAVYQIDGNDLRTVYGITVERCDGNLSFPKRKGVTAHSWPDEDGEESYTDAEDIVFEPRDIYLTGRIRGETRTAFLTKLNAFRKKLESAGLHSLYIGNTGITHSVYCEDGLSVSTLTKWSSGIMVAAFTLKLREPVPARAT